jgi:hypothetical protein
MNDSLRSFMARPDWIRLLRIALLFLVLVGAGKAGTVLDQINLPNPNGGGLGDVPEWQQQVTDGMGGVLAGVEIFSEQDCAQYYTFDCPYTDVDTVRVSIGLGPAPFNVNGPSAGTFAFSTTVTTSSSGTFVDTSAAGIDLTPGEKFVIDVSGGSGVAFLAPGGIYLGGPLFVSVGGGPLTDNVGGIPTGSLAFETFMAQSLAVPEPGPLPLIGGCLGLGIAWIRRRRV